MEDITKKYGYPFYPRMIKHPVTGQQFTVADHHTHGRLIGKKVREDATVVELPTPPTLETVLAAGYKEPAASEIVAEEQEKFEKGYKPYGDIEPPVKGLDVVPPPAVPVAETPDPSKVDGPAKAEGFKAPDSWD